MAHGWTSLDRLFRFFSSAAWSPIAAIFFGASLGESALGQSCAPVFAVHAAPTNVVVGDTIEVQIGMGAFITGGDAMRIEAVEFRLGVAMAYAGDERIHPPPSDQFPSCEYEVDGDGDGLCEPLEDEECATVSWSSVTDPASNVVTFTPDQMFSIPSTGSVHCGFVFDIVVEPPESDIESDEAEASYNGVCNTDPLLPAGAFGTILIFIGEVAIEKVCDAADADGLHPVEIVVTNVGGVLLVACRVSDEVFLDDPDCPPVGAPGDEILFPEFDLPVGGSQSLSGFVGPLTGSACNTATVTCDLAESPSQASSSADDVCGCPRSSICIHKEDTQGNPMADVRFEITGPETRECFTDQDGDCCLENLKAGTYDVGEPDPPEGYAFAGCTPDADPNTPGAEIVLDCGGMVAAFCLNEPFSEDAGCTPGFWKQPHHFKYWRTFFPADLVSDVFGVSPTDNPTLLEALEAGKGGEFALLRHAVAGLLNASSEELNYRYSVATVVDLVQKAFVKDEFSTTKNLLEEQNERGCPIETSRSGEHSSPSKRSIR